MSLDNLARTTITPESEGYTTPVADAEFDESWDDLLADADLAGVPIAERIGDEAQEASQQGTVRVGLKLHDLAQKHPYSVNGGLFPDAEKDFGDPKVELDPELVGLLFDRTPIFDGYIGTTEKIEADMQAAGKESDGYTSPMVAIRRSVTSAMERHSFPEDRIDGARQAITELVDNLHENVTPGELAPHHVGRFIGEIAVNRATGDRIFLATAINSSEVTRNGQAKKLTSQGGRGLGMVEHYGDECGTYNLDPRDFTAPFGELMSVQPESVGLRGVWFAIQHNNSPMGVQPDHTVNRLHA